MASNSEDQVEMYVDLTSPLSSVDVSSKDRSTIQAGKQQLHNCVLTQTSFSAIMDYAWLEVLKNFSIHIEFEGQLLLGN